MITLNTLNPEDIDEKIRLSIKDYGYDIYEFRKHIQKELKDFQWSVLREQIQCQCYVEQLEHINKRIQELEATGKKNWEV